MARQCLDGEPSLAPTLRQGRPEPESVVGALAAAHAAGAPIELSAFFAGGGAKAVPLPTYPFQRRRYWLNPASTASDPAALGQRALEHPFLAAAIEDPEGEGIAFSGRVSLAEHPWLADHAVLGAVILPGTAFLELALRAGGEVGAPAVEELILQAPLILSEGTAVALRVSLSAPDEQGRREIAIHSRADGEAEDWARNASGVLSAAVSPSPAPLTQWPPAAAEPLDLDVLRARLAEAGFEYGEAFEGLSAVWRDGKDLYAELSLPEGLEVGDFGAHPALLDAALHPLALAAGEGVRLPFSWSGASLLGGGTRELRVRVSEGEAGGAFELTIADGEGVPLGRASLALRGAANASAKRRWPTGDRVAGGGAAGSQRRVGGAARARLAGHGGSRQGGPRALRESLGGAPGVAREKRAGRPGHPHPGRGRDRPDRATRRRPCRGLGACPLCSVRAPRPLPVDRQ
jgi:acyl transferase domain-containing protein